MLVKIRDFQTEDKVILSEWLTERDCLVEDGEIPLQGYIAEVQDTPVACAFIRFCGKYGFIEGMTTNPSASSEQRHLSMNLLTMKILKEAKRGNLVKLIGYTVDQGILQRAKSLGFKEQPHIMFSYDLEGDKWDL